MADIEQMMRTLKLGGLAKDWREVEYRIYHLVIQCEPVHVLVIGISFQPIGLRATIQKKQNAHTVPPGTAVAIQRKFNGHFTAFIMNFRGWAVRVLLINRQSQGSEAIFFTGLRGGFQESIWDRRCGGFLKNVAIPGGLCVNCRERL